MEAFVRQRAPQVHPRVIRSCNVFRTIPSGVMGGVNTVLQYISTVGIGVDRIIDTTRQEGYVPLMFLFMT